MHWILLTVMASAIHAIPFEDYQSCISAGSQLAQFSPAIKYVCVER